MKKFATALALTFCLSGGIVSSLKAEDENMLKIGVSFNDFADNRCVFAYKTMWEIAKLNGVKLIEQIADGDAKLQNDQVESLTYRGVKAVIIIPQDGAMAVKTVDRLARAGIPVIAFAGFIPSSNLAAFLSFDSRAIGRAQAKSIIASKDFGRFVFLNGSLTEHYASTLVRDGQMEILQPYIKSGKIKLIADRWDVSSFPLGNATLIMEEILQASNNQVDAVMAFDDDTAIKALEALKSQGLEGKVLLTSQDATALGCHYVAKGEITMTVLKDFRLIAPLALEIAIRLARKETLDGMGLQPLKNFTDFIPQGTAEIPCKFYDITIVNKQNLYNQIVIQGFQEYGSIHYDLPEKDRPPRPQTK